MEYFSRMLAKKEMFAEEPSADTTTSTTTTLPMGAIGTGILGLSILIVVVSFIAAFGAARLSYCYNLSVGNGSSTALMFAVICFIFPSLYYPYYALFLNPLCNPPASSSVFQLGGTKRNGRK